MPRVSELNPRFRTKEQIANDAAYILKAPISYGTKFAVLSEVTWVWTEYFGKYIGCPYWSEQALKLPRKGLEKACTHEHVVPKQIVTDELFALTGPSASEVYTLLDRLLIGCIITKEEDNRLSSAGYGYRMPAEFYDDAHVDYLNPWVRYKKCGIVWQRLRDKEDASIATVMGSEATMQRLGGTPEEDEAWKHL